MHLPKSSIVRVCGAAAAPVLGNGPAWVGHYVFQRNRPGVFTYPLYGFIGSWVMTWHVVTRKIPI